MTDTLEFPVMSAAGNRFAVVDAFDGLPVGRPERVARSVCRQAGLDGVLVLEPPKCSGSARMAVFNADGSRAAACGNGLRCIALLATENGRVDGHELRVETDTATQRVRLHGAGKRARVATAEMGEPRVDEELNRLPVLGEDLPLTVVNVGNTHCVLSVDDVDSAPVHQVGPALEGHDAFPDGTNVAFVEVRGGALRARFWERGVGETESCGSGACAAAVWAIRCGRVSSPVNVETRGGRLIVEWDPGGALRLTGPVQRIGKVRLRPR